MSSISVDYSNHKKNQYPILFGCYIKNVISLISSKRISQVVIITDHHVKQTHANELYQQLKSKGLRLLLLSFKAGERAKNYQTKQKIENAMCEHLCDKASFIIALGGGVVGDLAGFIAATYFRGISYIQVPTTLLAMVDSSIGGKTGINTDYGKNLIGRIHHPEAVITDIKLLKTLPKKHLLNGLIEAIKMFLTHDAQSFYFTVMHLKDILHHQKESSLQEIIYRAACIKASVVTQDNEDNALRDVLNFGHTMGHALEKVSHYKILHGYAVAYGILIETTIAQLLGVLSKRELIIIKTFLAQLNIHGKDLKPYTPQQLIQASKQDKKCKHGYVNYILLESIGKTRSLRGNTSYPVKDAIVRQAISLVCEERTL